jgi:glycine hydroxymethyltransferase
LPAAVTSGLRLGSAAVTTRGFTPADMEHLGAVIARVLKAPDDERVRSQAAAEVAALSTSYPVPGITHIEGG